VSVIGKERGAVQGNAGVTPGIERCDLHRTRNDAANAMFTEVVAEIAAENMVTTSRTSPSHGTDDRPFA
jgi:hypothetical protein